MGTRSLTRVFNDEQEIVCVYQQFDGYPTGVGVELAELLASRPFVNGISGDGPCFNGMGCFAAQMIAARKQGAGNVYLYAPGSKGCGEEYVYEVRGGHRVNGEWQPQPLPVTVKVFAYDKLVYDGDIAGFKAFCERDGEAEESA